MTATRNRSYRSDFFTDDEAGDTYTCPLNTCSAFQTDVPWGHSHDQSREPQVTDRRTVVIGGADATLTTYAPGAHQATRRPVVIDGPTAKQVAFLRRLLVERLGADVADATFTAMHDDLRDRGEWTKAQVSSLIDSMVNDGTSTTSPSSDAGTDSRPRNRYAGTCTRCGTEVAAEAGYRSKANGRWVVEHESCEAAPAAAPAEEAPEGVHFLDGTIYKVVRAVHASGNRYAKRLVIEEGHGRWEYEGRRGAFRSLSSDTLLTLEQAAEYGHLYGVCGVCGKTLTDEESIERGIGPVCYGNLS